MLQPPNDIDNLLKILREAVTKVPSLKYAWGIIGIAIAISLVQIFVLSGVNAANYQQVFPIVALGTGAMILVFLFSRVVSSTNLSNKNPKNIIGNQVIKIALNILIIVTAISASIVIASSSIAEALRILGVRINPSAILITTTTNKCQKISRLQFYDEKKRKFLGAYKSDEYGESKFNSQGDTSGISWTSDKPNLSQALLICKIEFSEAIRQFDFDITIDKINVDLLTPNDKALRIYYLHLGEELPKRAIQSDNQAKKFTDSPALVSKESNGGNTFKFTLKTTSETEKGFQLILAFSDAWGGKSGKIVDIAIKEAKLSPFKK